MDRLKYVLLLFREKALDLNSKLFTMIGKLKDKPDDENLLDECLILPSSVKKS